MASFFSPFPKALTRKKKGFQADGTTLSRLPSHFSANVFRDPRSVEHKNR
ncbi:Uncharacterized protein APZ42_025775 [Daphnia magna]|uniref:Uncharacterized protein n=1 Tax=Daphnia magna TaxID=35525 RepID=A0A164SUB0_9CRUS|nr:Uncharacterized protein APZ42_025775 [Daphnia magna]